MIIKIYNIFLKQIFTAIVVLIFPFMGKTWLGFLIFGSISLVCFFGMLIWVKETKGKTADQIEAMFLKKDILLEEDKVSLETGTFN